MSMLMFLSYGTFFLSISYGNITSASDVYDESATTRLHPIPTCTPTPKLTLFIHASFQPGILPFRFRGPKETSQLELLIQNTKTTLKLLRCRKYYSPTLSLSLHTHPTMLPTLGCRTVILVFLVAVVGFPAVDSTGDLPMFSEAPAFRNGRDCPKTAWSTLHKRAHDHSVIHIAMTLDATYLRGSVAGVFSVLQHSSCPENVVFHFIATTHRRSELRRIITSTFPYLNFHLYHFDSNLVKGKISYSIRRALDQPLNYARMYLADLLPAGVHRIIYFDSDLIVVDDVAKLWNIDLGTRVLGAPEYCHANLTNYFTPKFWSNPTYAASFRGRKPCYFNTGVMVIDLWKWREGKYTEKLENWMRIQKRHRIYELGSLPPFLLVFAGEVERVEHRWNQHGLGGDNLEGLCRDLHPGPVSLLHWSGKGKPWLRLDSKKPCPLDSLWAPYDLFRHSRLFSDS